MDFLVAATGSQNARPAALAEKVRALIERKSSQNGKGVRFVQSELHGVTVLEKKGQNSWGQDQDDTIFAPYTTVQKKFRGITFIQNVTVSAASPENIKKVADDIAALLRVRHKIQPGDNDDFMVRTLEDIAAVRTEATKTMTALLASIAARLPTLHVLDLDHIDDPLTQATVHDITLDKPVRDVVPVPKRDLALIVHDDARTVLGLLDLTTNSTSPLLGVGKLDSYDFTPSGSHLIGATQGVSRIGFVALDNLHPTDFRLDDPPARVLSTATGKIFVDHGDPLGHATIIPSPTATRDDALVLDGFLTTNLLDQEP